MEEKGSGRKDTRRIVFPGSRVPDIVLEVEDLGGVKAWVGSVAKGFFHFQKRPVPKKFQDRHQVSTDTSS